MDNTTTNIPAAADPAQAEENRTAATGLGKFRDVDALLEAYTSLEAEFTRRSQRLKELERAVKEAAPAQAAASDTPSPQAGQSGAQLSDAAKNDEEVKAQIIAEYLENAAKNRSVPLISGGVKISARRRVPASVREAGALAQQFLNKRR